ncbi:helix-turn-helix transcriptional regulator [Streptacidiphilus sp. 4-A2]|nr:helix-turn-helix transcriptional regulator [Streptacidiphilus sp. 4-A2]
MDPAAAPTPLHILLRKARRRAGLTQQQLAGLSTVSIRTIRDLERARVRHPRQSTLDLLANAMRLSHAHRTELRLAARQAPAEAIIRAVFGPDCAVPPRPPQQLVGRRSELRTLDTLISHSPERLLATVGLPASAKPDSHRSWPVCCTPATGCPCSGSRRRTPKDPRPTPPSLPIRRPTWCAGSVNCWPAASAASNSPPPSAPRRRCWCSTAVSPPPRPEPPCCGCCRAVPG